MESTTILEDSLKEFENKKQNCLQLLDQIAAILIQYEEDFSEQPQGEMLALPEGSDNTSQKKSNVFLTAAAVNDVRAKIADASLKILIAGQFKTGKSTCINALLGCDVLPAYSTPCTAVITEINYAEKPYAELVFKKNLTDVPNDLCADALAHINKYKPNVPDLRLEANLSDVLEDYLVIPMSGKEQRESVAESPYALCRLFWPLKLCANKVQIIDSPGINEAEERDRTTMEYVPNVDMVIHVLTALQCYSKSDASFDRDVQGYGNPPLLFLINRFDQINNDKERERLRRHVYEELKLQNKTGDFGRDGVLFVSAYKALEAKQNEDSLAYAKAGFEEFEGAMARIISKQRGKIKFGHIKSVANDLHILASNHVDSIRRLLDHDVKQLEKKYAEKQTTFKNLEDRENKIKEKIQREIESFTKSIETHIREFLYDFCDHDIERIIMNASVSKINFMSHEDDEKRVLEELNAALKEGIKDAFANWSNTKGSEIIKERIQDIKESIDADLKEFKEELLQLRRDFGIQVADLESEVTDDFFAAFLGGGFAGGVASFFILRFVAAFGGPVGWLVAGLATLASAILSMLNLTDPQEKIKKQFIAAAEKKMRADIAKMASEISAEIKKDFSQKILTICEYLEGQIEANKKTIEEAIVQLGNTQSSIEEKKQKLEYYRDKFLTFANDAQKLGDAL